MGEATTSVTTTLTSAGGVEEGEEEVRGQLKEAIEDRKLLRRHCKRLEEKASSLEALVAAKSALVAEAERQLGRAVEDKKLLRRHARAFEEEWSSKVKAATEAAEARGVEADMFRRKVAAAREEAEAWREREAAAAAAAGALAAMERSQREADEAERRSTLRESQLVVQALREEVERLRSGWSEAEAQAVHERTRAEAARQAAGKAAEAARLAESAAKNRLGALVSELEASHAAKLGDAEDRLLKAEAQSRSSIEEQARRAKRQVDAAVAAAVATAAEVFGRAAAAGDAAFAAAAASRDREPAQRKSPTKVLARFSPPAAMRHKWRTETIRVTFREGHVGLHVARDERGVRVTRVRGAGLAAGAAAGDYVLALNGRALGAGISELEFASLVAREPRPLVIDLARDVPVDRDKDGWLVENDEHPCPAFGVYSPVVQHVLAQWSSEPNKLQYVRLWLGVAANADNHTVYAPSKFPRGLQLAGLRREVLDGFLTLVVPLLRRARGAHNVTAKTRPVDDPPTKWDLALRVDIPEPPATPATSETSSSSAQQTTTTTTQPRRSLLLLGAPSSSSSSSSGTPPTSSTLTTSTTNSEDEESRAVRDKLAAQRRKAVEEKLAKMRDHYHR